MLPITAVSQRREESSSVAEWKMRLRTRQGFEMKNEKRKLCACRVDEKFTQCVGARQGKILGLTFHLGKCEHDKHRMCFNDF